MINQCRKWTLFGFCLFEIVLAIIMVSVGIAAVNHVQNTDPNIKPEDFEAAKVNLFSFY